MTRKNKLPEAPARLDHKDEVGKTDLLPGWPGYRTRDGRSGYDPIDTRTEAAHVSGSIIRDLFTGNLMLRNRLSLSLSGVLGLLLVAPVFITVLELIKGNLFS